MKNLILQTPNSQLTTKTAIILALTIACLLLSYPAQAATYYLDAVNGNDANPGTNDAPWRTIPYTWSAARAGNIIAEGDTVLFRNGNYGTFRESTNDNPPSKYHFHRTAWVTYKADTGQISVNFDNIFIDNRDHYSSPLYQSGESYLWFEGITVSSGSCSFTGTNYIKLINCNLTGPVTTFPGAYKSNYIADNHNLVYGNIVNDLTVEGCDLSKGYRAVQQAGSCARWIIRDCNISDFAETGVMVVGDDYTYTNNHMQRIGGTSNTGGGWPLRGTMNGTFTPNEVIVQDTTGATGICYKTSGTDYYIYQTSATNFASNYTVTGQSSNATLTNTSIVGAIHSAMIYGAKGNNLTITNNVFLSDNYLALYGDGGPITNLHFSNNLMYGNRAAGLDFVFISGVTSGDFSNNTIICPASVRLDVSHNYRNVVIDTMYNNIIVAFGQNADHTYTSQVVSHGNNIFGNNPDQTGHTYNFVTNGTELKSQTLSSGYFTNYAGNDFTLLPTSSAVNFGDPAYTPTTDILGNQRDSQPDAGCYEYIEEASGIAGDINSDGSVDAVDLQLIINMILAGTFDSKADLNSDSSVDAIDLQALVNIILAG